jgi:ubiquinone/menaquinone biosynthesis C-methylase UbiE
MSNSTTFDFSNVNWDIYAKSYDALLQLTPYREMINEIVSIINQQESDKILDAGCGTGNVLSALLKTRIDSIYYGMDFSKYMLAVARNKVVGNKVTLIESSLNATLPFSCNSLTKIISTNVLYALEYPEKVLREFWRIMSPGGRLFIVTPKINYDNGLILKAHCKSKKPDSYWMNAHSASEREELLLSEAVPDLKLLEEMKIVAIHNRHIAQTSLFHFFTPENLLNILRKEKFNIELEKSTYADQAILIIAQKKWSN